jgi:amino acid adenylation domain-containing protein
VLLEEVRVLYPAQREGRTAELPVPKSDYADFVQWQSEMLSSPGGERLRSYWTENLADVPHVLELPADRPRPPVFSQRAGVVPFHVPVEVGERLRALAADEKVTMFTVLLAAFQVLLGRWSGQRNFVVGAPFSGRTRPGFEETVGNFVNLLPLRASLEGNPTFRDLVQRVGTTVVEGLQHQDYPFPAMLDDFRVPRDRSRPPLIQVSFVLEKSHRRVEEGRARFLFPETTAHRNVGGLLEQAFYVEHHTCQHEIELILEHAGGAIQGMFRYCRDLFDASMIGYMARRYETLLAHAATSPQQTIAQLPWFPDQEREQVLSAWNQTRVEFPSDLCLHQLFEQQAARTPDAVALRYGERTYRYHELEAWSNRLADRLQVLGAQPGKLCALGFERSPEMVAAMLATLKTGAAFVPVDPHSPADRLRRILADTAADVLLTEREFLSRMRLDAVHVICVDDEPSGPSDFADVAPLHSTVQPSDLAYVVYTSGSTGQPKGVMVEHRAICNTIYWRHRDLPVSSDDRVLLLLPCFFDAALGIIFSTITQGAELVLAEPHAELNPTALLERVAASEITVLPCPPRLLNVLLDEPRFSQCGSLRRVYSGGEPMPATLPSRLAEQLVVSLHNLYGPTEVAVEATCWTSGANEQREIIPIGAPIANVHVYVLDAERQLLPVGVPGELYIGGAGVARGYLNDPERSAERFLRDPFCDVPGARMYRTGDCCRWLPDGNLEFLGRLDEQVKVNGRRVEPGEIEHVLKRHETIQDAAVIVHNGSPNHSQLIAYVVAEAEVQLVDEVGLRRYLLQQLPAYMIPSAIVPLPRLPRTPSGKLDRRSLPEPSRVGTARRHPFVAPRTPLEEYLADLWRSTLQVERVGVLDGFYDLGGTSLQAAMLASRLQNSLNQRIQTAALFDYTDIASLANHLAETYPDTIAERFGTSRCSGAAAATMDPVSELEPTAVPAASVSRTADLLVPLQAEGNRRPLFMVHPPGGIVVCYQPLAKCLGAGQPLYGIRARGLHGERDLPTRLEDMAAEYVSAIRSTQAKGPYAVGGWSLGGVVALEIAQQFIADRETVDVLVLLDTTIPSGPVNRQYSDESDTSGLEYGLDIGLEQLGELGPDEQLPFLWDHVRKLGLIDEDTPQELVQQILDDLKSLFHAHVQLASEYALRPYPGKITLYRPQDAPVQLPTPRDRGWGQLADDVEVHFVPGQHHTMVKQPHVEVLARHLRACLERVTSD